MGINDISKISNNVSNNNISDISKIGLMVNGISDNDLSDCSLFMFPEKTSKPTNNNKDKNN